MGIGRHLLGFWRLNHPSVAIAFIFVGMDANLIDCCGHYAPSLGLLALRLNRYVSIKWRFNLGLMATLRRARPPPGLRPVVWYRHGNLHQAKKKKKKKDKKKRRRK